MLDFKTLQTEIFNSFIVTAQHRVSLLGCTPALTADNIK